MKAATGIQLVCIELSSIASAMSKMQDAQGGIVELLPRTDLLGKYRIGRWRRGKQRRGKLLCRRGLAIADEAIIDHLVVANVHESVFPALGQSVTLHGDETGALGGSRNSSKR